MMDERLPRRGFLARLGVGAVGLPIFLGLGLGGCRLRPEGGGGDTWEGYHRLLPRETWRTLLPPDRFHILFEGGTERAGSSPLDDIKDPGTYICAACFQPLFSSETKYDSGTGWPSFWTHLPNAIGTRPDHSLFMRRTECHCSRCGGHQGHVFSDGPPPTGERWCINGLALIFVPEGDPLPELRGG